ncbi:lysozyme inhibitor LprI family protein [Luteibacter yeojuensis]
MAVDATLGIRRPYTDCISGGGPTTAAMLRCAHDEFIFQDKRLNDIYRTLTARLSVQDKTELRSAERAWLVDKKRRCALPEDPGTTDQVTSADCEVREAAKRAAELERRDRRTSASVSEMPVTIKAKESPRLHSGRLFDSVTRLG